MDVTARLVLFSHEGSFVLTVEQKKYTNVRAVNSSIHQNEFSYSTEGFVDPLDIRIVWDMPQDSEIFFSEPSLVKSEEYTVTQEWFKSNDGTDVPMFIVKRGDIKIGNVPTIVLVYGGFGQAKLPFYLRLYFPWLSRGGMFALVNVRGGGEFGHGWYLSAIRENKIKSFEDLEKSLEFLAQKYTKPEHIGLIGASNGGMLVAGSAIRKPNSCAAVVSKVPLADMLNFHKYGMAKRWIAEYGNPENVCDREFILKWSPLHNIVSGEKYPVFLVMTGENDTRVAPMHSKKLVACLQAHNGEAYLQLDKKTGHGQGKTKDSAVSDHARVLAFFQFHLKL